MSMKLTCGEFIGLAYANEDELREFTEEILAENKKLRELIRYIWVYDYAGNFSTLPEHTEHVDKVWNCMQELGIKVDA